MSQYMLFLTFFDKFLQIKCYDSVMVRFFWKKCCFRFFLPKDGADHTKGHDDLINGIIEKYLGEFVFTPADMKVFHGRWPSARELKKVFMGSQFLMLFG